MHLRWPFRSGVLVMVSLAMPWFAMAASAITTAEDTAGKVLLQVEQNGEAWYVDPRSMARHYLGRPADALAVMSGLGLGIAHTELEEYLADVFPSRLAGRILLDVEQYGEAYYVSPDTFHATYLGRPADAFAIMVSEGRGITDADLSRIPAVVGYSEQGRAIGGFDLGEGDYCIVLLASVHGAKESGGTSFLRRLMAGLTEEEGRIHPDKRVIAIPVVNPDGLAMRTDKFNANGVNVNRNFLTTDWAVGEKGTTTYAGTSPFSEAESRTIRDATEVCEDGAMISFHARGTFVNPEISERSIALAQWYAQKSGYDLVEGWYFAGTATRWFEEKLGAPALTVEMTDYAADDWELNRDAVWELITTDRRF